METDMQPTCVKNQVLQKSEKHQIFAFSQMALMQFQLFHCPFLDCPTYQFRGKIYSLCHLMRMRKKSLQHHSPDKHLPFFFSHHWEIPKQIVTRPSPSYYYRIP